MFLYFFLHSQDVVSFTFSRCFSRFSLFFRFSRSLNTQNSCNLHHPQIFLTGLRNTTCWNIISAWEVLFFAAEALQTPQGKLQHTTALRMPLGRMHLVAGLCVLKSLLHMVYILPCTEKMFFSVHSKKYQVLAVI